MSSVSYFQRYSQQENHVTNNTLLMLRHFYQESPQILKNVFSELFESDVRLGVEFAQQHTGSKSVLDASIVQSPLNIFVETKRGAVLDASQIEAHLASIHDMDLSGGQAYLIGLTTKSIDVSKLSEFKSMAVTKSIVFENITFSSLVDTLENNCPEYSANLSAVLGDYRDYISGEGLFDDRHAWMTMFPCGISIAENERFHVYYERPIRAPKTSGAYIGIYANKCVQFVGEIRAIAVCSNKSGKVEVLSEELGKITGENLARIEDIIKETKYYDLAVEPVRFYLSDEYVATDFRKTTPGGIRSARYCDLRNLIDDYDVNAPLSAKSLAAELSKHTF